MNSHSGIEQQVQEVLLAVYFLPKTGSLFVGRNLRQMKVFIFFKLSIFLSSIIECCDCLLLGDSVFLEI